MKKMILMLLLGLNANADELIVDDSIYDVNIALNEETVQCLVGDYSASSLKIVVPDIIFYANLDHTSAGAPGPCITAGFCKASKDESDFTFPSATDYRLPIFQDILKPTEKIKMRVLKKEEMSISKNGCRRLYSETISAVVRGVVFSHYASMPLAEISKEKCELLKGAL